MAWYDFGFFIFPLVINHVTNENEPSHPMLYFSFKDIPGLRRKAEISANHIFKTIESAVTEIKANKFGYLPPKNIAKFKSAWNEKYGNNLGVLAMYCVVRPEDSEALGIALEYMERLTNFSSWEVSSTANDEMPISHTLVGFATAYDFLYNHLTLDQRERYFKRMRRSTLRNFERFKKAPWGQQHLQNHVLNNCVGILTAALVVQVHDPRASLWVRLITKHLNISMNLLTLIVDGSLDEGVPYSTYTSRSLTMFAFFAKRHMGLDYYSNKWFSQYFWFIYETVLPGFIETVGIADSNPHWFYGPESQLVFIDAFAMKNGYGNWLASRIRENRQRDGYLKQPFGQRWTTYHTEFLWYDPGIPEKAPDKANESELYLFSDWGVVTYGAHAPLGSTFLSFKSGYLHGRAINHALNYHMFNSIINGWDSLNPGHEHPDQNSFTFWPRGQPFISEGYYGSKFSFKNNVLMFAPSQRAKCFPPYEGQIGECYKWLDWFNPEASRMHGEVVASYNEDEYVFISGEAVGSYSDRLKLKSVYRAVLLITPDVLLVVDHVEALASCDLEMMAAFFQMSSGALNVTVDDDSHPEAVLAHHDNSKSRVMWRTSNDKKTVASSNPVQDSASPSGTRDSQYLNISIPMSADHVTRVAYVFAGPGPSLQPPQFISNSSMGYIVQVKVDGITYNLAVSTQHDNLTGRMTYLGHTGFATLTTGESSEVTYFGYDQFKFPVTSHPTTTQVQETIDMQQLQRSVDNHNTLTILLVFTMVTCCLVGVRFWYNHKSINILLVLPLAVTVVAVLFVLVMLHSISFLPEVLMIPPTGFQYGNSIMPSVFISSMKWGGSDIVGELFAESDDFVYAQIPEDLHIPTAFSKQFNDMCIWRNVSDQNGLAMKWIYDRLTKPDLVMKQKQYDWRSTLYHKRSQSYSDRCVALSGTSGSWNLKLPWIQSVIGDGARIIYVVRDPRSWVTHILTNNLYDAVKESVIESLRSSKCLFKKNYAWQFESVRNLVERTLSDEFVDPVLFLSNLWYADTITTLYNLKEAENFLIIKIEDLVLNPEETAKMIFAFVGTPLTTASLHQVLQLTRSNYLPQTQGDELRDDNLFTWVNELSKADIRIIEDITDPAMEALQYERLTYNENLESIV